MPENNYLSLIIFAPLLGAAINWLIGRRVRNEAFIGLVACGAVAVSMVVAFVVAFNIGGFQPAAVLSTTGTPVVAMDHLWTWIQVGRFRADFGLGMDRLSAIYVCFITFVGLLIHIFATGYMHGDKGFYRFFAYLNLFMFSMLTLVLADNLLLMFVGWEGVGLCSYLLIGYYTNRKEAGDAAKKAFIANRVGDWGVVLGIMLLFFLTGSISFYDKPALGVSSAMTAINAMNVDPATWGAIVAGGITSLAVLLFIGATGKSAQIPLYVWLPDAMAGPTPVSALIHAATMVTAGVYLVVRCSAIFSHAPMALFIIAVIGAATAIFAATIGLAQNDIKKVLAYSTVSQLGYMFLACGVGAYIAAIFHVMTHAFFKALLFLGSGSVIHGMHHEQDMRRMGGLKKYMPVTFATMAVGWLAICGVPLFSGFFSKDEILWKTYSTQVFGHSTGTLLWGIGALTALLTAVYMTRLMVMTFWGQERFRDAHAGEHAAAAHAHGTASAAGSHHGSADIHDHPVGLEEDEDEAHVHHGPITPHESPWVMTVPLIILAVLAFAGGYVGVPHSLSSMIPGLHLDNYFEKTLEPVVIHPPDAHAVAAGAGAAMPTTHGTVEPSHGGAVVSPDAHSVQESATAEHAAEGAHSPDEVRKERLFTGISVVIALFGMTLGWIIFNRRPLLKMPRLLENKYYVDEIYNTLIINPIKWISREGLWKIFDVGVIDGIVNGIGRGVAEIGGVVRYLQIGFVRSYAALILIGALAVIGYFIVKFIPFVR